MLQGSGMCVLVLGPAPLSILAAVSCIKINSLKHSHRTRNTEYQLFWKNSVHQIHTRQCLHHTIKPGTKYKKKCARQHIGSVHTKLSEASHPMKNMQKNCHRGYNTTKRAVEKKNTVFWLYTIWTLLNGWAGNQQVMSAKPECVP